jgi:hypothetical protein
VNDPVVPGQLARAVVEIRRRVEFAKGWIWGGFPDQSFLVCVAAMNHVVWSVNPFAWASRVANGEPLPSADAESALERQAGLCGHAAITYAAIVSAFELPVRPVQFYWRSSFGDRSHIACEVFYADAWHFFDPTWGVFYEQGGIVLGIESVRAGAACTLRRDETLLYALIGDSWADLDCLTDPTTRVEVAAYEFEMIRRTARA